MATKIEGGEKKIFVLREKEQKNNAEKCERMKVKKLQRNSREWNRGDKK